MLFQTNIQTILVFILNPLAMFIFIVLGGIKFRDAWKKGGNPFNIVLGLFFLMIVAGILVNIYYASVKETLDLETYVFLARLSAFLITYSSIFPTFFALAILKGFSGIVTKEKIIYFTVWTIAFGLLLFVGTVEIQNYTVKYDDVFAIYAFFPIISIAILFLGISYKNLTVFQDATLKRKYTAFIVGYLLYISSLINTDLMLWGMIPKSLGTLYFALVMIPSGYLIYWGIGKKIEE